MSNKTKLELTWIGKDQRPRLEPRVLVEDPSKSYHAPERVTDHDQFDNRLIFGDNLLALKALEQEFTGKIKCVYIDPPYNTGSAFEHYDDGVEHSLWLSLMRDRLELLWRLLSQDGTIWITIDDHEGHYLKVLCDEVFGRSSFVASIVWENFYGRSNAAAISPSHNYILVYSPLGLNWKKIRNLLPRDDRSSSKYRNTDNDPRGPWRAGPIFASEERHDGLMYSIRTPSGREVKAPRGSHWRMSEPDFWSMVNDKRITFGDAGDNIPAIKLYLSEVQDGLVPRTLWPHTEAGHSQEAKRELQSLFPDVIPFDTPKPERLLQRVIEISTNPGDWVLDSFAGSGTTGAVAHKMNRKWIMVELGQHCQTNIIPRLRKIIDGQDGGGISSRSTLIWEKKLTLSMLRDGASILKKVTEIEQEHGDEYDGIESKIEEGCLRLYGLTRPPTGIVGGGFRYFSIAPSLLQQDSFGNWIINKQYNAELLAQAVCKIEGFQYAPSDSVYWQQGQSSEHDFIYVTTQTLSRQQIEALAEEVGPSRSLVIYCHAFRVKNLDEFPNLTLKKIPKTVIEKCEWGKDDYSLEIKAMQPAVPEPDDPPPPPRRKPKRVSSQPRLPGMEGDE